LGLVDISLRAAAVTCMACTKSIISVLDAVCAFSNNCNVKVISVPPTDGVGLV